MVTEISSKLQEEKMFPDEMMKVLLTIRPSKQFVDFVNKLYVRFSNKNDQDKLLAMFYKEIVKEWKAFFPSCTNQKAVNLLLIHFPQKLVAYHKKNKPSAFVSDSQVILQL